MDEMLNNINKKIEVLEKKYDDLEEKYKLIKEENKKYKNDIQNNEQTIMILKKQILLVRKENQINLKKLEEYFIKQFSNLKQLQENRENIKKANNEIIINEKNDGIMKIETIYEEMIQIMDKKIKEFGMNFVKLLDDNKIKKKFEEIEPSPKKIKKNKENINIKKCKIDELLINKLVQIFSEQSPNIKEDDMNDLKKICSAMLINQIEPAEKINNFLVENIDNYKNEQDKISITNYAMKKAKLFENINKISLNKLDIKNEQLFIKQLREIYGITEKDYCDKNIKKLLKKGDKEIDILKKILIKRKYLK